MKIDMVAAEERKIAARKSAVKQQEAADAAKAVNKSSQTQGKGKEN
jgi:hypothetical protein